MPCHVPRQVEDCADSGTDEEEQEWKELVHEMEDQARELSSANAGEPRPQPPPETEAEGTEFVPQPMPEPSLMSASAPAPLDGSQVAADARPTTADVTLGASSQYYVPWTEAPIGRITPWKPGGGAAISVKCMLKDHHNCGRIYSQNQLTRFSLGDGMEEAKCWLLAGAVDGLSHTMHHYMSKPVPQEVRDKFAPREP